MARFFDVHSQEARHQYLTAVTMIAFLLASLSVAIMAPLSLLSADAAGSSFAEPGVTVILQDPWAQIG